MAKYIQIHINTACHQHWDEMQSTASGAFCQSCQKNVIDFTCMTDSQLIEYFKNKPTGVCGKFYTDQLDKQLEMPVKKIPWLKYFFQISLPALLFSYKANAQRLVKKHLAPVVMVTKKSYQPIALATERKVTGKITWKAGEPVSFASVMIKGSQQGTVADINAVFTLEVPAGTRFLEVTSAGYEKKLVAITDGQTNAQLDIALSENINLEPVLIKSNYRSITMGGAMRSVSVTSIWGNPLKKPMVSKETMQLFPNPAKRNSQVTLRFNEPVFNNQQMILYNASGMKLYQETIYVTQRATEAPLNIHVHAAGNYVLHIVDMKTHKTQVAKLIVE